MPLRVGMGDCHVGHQVEVLGCAGKVPLGGRSSESTPGIRRSSSPSVAFTGVLIPSVVVHSSRGYTRREKKGGGGYTNEQAEWRAQSGCEVEEQVGEQ